MFAQRAIEVTRPAMQGSLLTMGEPGCPLQVGPLTHTDLGRGAWIDHASGWLPGADAWFDELHDTLAWKHATRPMYENIVVVPRLIWSRSDDEPHDSHAGDSHTGDSHTGDSHTGDSHTGDSGGRASMAAIASRLDVLADRFGEHYGRPLRRIQANLYRDGRDSVAWHRDKVVDRHDSMVAIVSLGAARTFAIRPHGGGDARRFELGWGDLIVMGGSMQQHWEHAVPKAAGASARISVMFRS